MHRRTRMMGLAIATALASTPLLAPAQARAATTTCTSFSQSIGGFEDQDAPVNISISANPSTTFHLIVRVLNNGKVIGRVTATTDAQGMFSGTIPTSFDPSKQMEGTLETIQIGCNTPVIVGLKIQT